MVLKVSTVTLGPDSTTVMLGWGRGWGGGRGRGWGGGRGWGRGWGRVGCQG